MSEPEAPPSPFANVPAVLAATLAKRGFTELTPVQAAVVGAEAGRDLLVSARTGSGKTVAFGLRMAGLINDGTPRGKPRALVVCPTRELAMQVAKELDWLFAGGPGTPALRVVACVGGMDPRRESMALGAGVEVVVGTPGRLCDHINRKNLRLDDLRVAVLDEADEMLDMGFRDELEVILQACPATRQTVLFSATFPPLAVALAEQYTKAPLRLALSDAKEPHGDIQWVAMLHAPREREAVVVNVLRHYDSRAALVFCHTRETVHRIHATLSERGFSAVVLSGDLGQAERTRALTAVRDGRARVLVATNVAARGIDLPTLDLVIHADMPHDVESFTHRSGRTGRAGRKGIAVVLVAASRRRAADRLFQQAGVKPERLMPPRAEHIRTSDEGRLTASILEGLTTSGDEDLVLAEKLLAEHSPAALVASLVASYRLQLPTPEDLPETFALGRSERPNADRPARFVRDQGPMQRSEPRGFDRPRNDGARNVDGPRNDGPRQDPRHFDGPRNDGPRQDPRSFDGPRNDGPQRFERPARPDPRRDDDRGPRQDPGFNARPRGQEPRFQRDERPNEPDRGPQRFTRDDRATGGRTGGAESEGPRQTEPDRGGQSPPTKARPPGKGGAAMFKVNRGFKHNAEPFWLVPLFCRRGRVDRQVIGRIDIRERETWFEIDPSAAEEFAASVSVPDKREPGVRFDRVE